MKTARASSLMYACLALLLALGASVGLAQNPQKVFSDEQLDQMLAPLALYPDSLLSQILMASTYPGEVADAAAWSKAHASAKGDAAVKQVSDKSWDPSVQSMVAFPQVLAQMQAHPDEVQKIGDAFLAEPEDVMASVQRLRTQAKKAGHLETTEQQKVVTQPAAEGNTTIIQIEPADPEIVYVPSYNPTHVYGTWPYPSYPPLYWPPPPGVYHPIATGIATGLAFGAGIAIADSLWGGFNWGRNDVNININRYNNLNVNNRISGSGNTNWKHNAQNRRGTPYRDQRSRQQYGQGVSGANQRDAFRGRDVSRDASRQRAQQSFDRNSSNMRAAQRSAQGRSSAGPRNNAFSGARSPDTSQRQRSRGQTSQRSMSSSRGAGAGRQMSRPTPSRGGGRRR